MQHRDDSGKDAGPRGSYFTPEQARRAHRLHKRAIEIYKTGTKWLEAVKQAAEEIDDAEAD